MGTPYDTVLPQSLQFRYTDPRKQLEEVAFSQRCMVLY